MAPFYFFTLCLTRHKYYIYTHIYTYEWLHIYKTQIYLCEVEEQPKRALIVIKARAAADDHRREEVS